MLKNGYYLAICKTMGLNEKNEIRKKKLIYIAQLIMLHYQYNIIYC